MTYQTVSGGIRHLLTIMVLVGAVGLMLRPAWAAPDLIDDFEQFEGWSTVASKGVQVEIAVDEGRDGMAMRLDFDFDGNSGFVIARKAFPIDLPPNFAFRFDIRGDALENQLEVKIVSPDERDVWRAVYPRFTPPSTWKTISLRRRHFDYAWGTGNRDMAKMGWLEFAISSEQGGRGSIWLDQLDLAPRPLADVAAPLPEVTASTSTPFHPPTAAFDGFDESSWQTGSLSEDQWLLMDFQQLREYGGLIIDWGATDYATAYDLMQSDDGETWKLAARVTSTNGGRDYIYMPDAESKYLRLDLRSSSRGNGYGIRNIYIQPYQFSSTPNRFFETVARDSEPGTYPRYLLGRQTYWAVAGVAADAKEALINGDGMVELEKSRFSIEPFLFIDDRLVTWNDVQLAHSLEEGYLPIPSVTWTADGLSLLTTALATGEPGASELYLRYLVRNLSAEQRQATLSRSTLTTPPR